MSVAGQVQLGTRHPACLEPVDLTDEVRGIHDHAVGDDRGDVVVEDTRRDQLQGEALTVDHHRVPGVVTALVANDEGMFLGELIGNLRLSFVSPLTSDDHGDWHGRPG
jgi:hypothetical protein